MVLFWRWVPGWLEFFWTFEFEFCFSAFPTGARACSGYG